VRTSVDVHNFLVEQEAPHEVFAARGRLRSPERIAAVLDLPPGEVGRVVILEGPGGPVAAVAPSDRVVNPASVAKALQRHELAPVADSRASELTGYLQEAIPPAGLPSEFTVVMDRSLEKDRVFYFPGGEARVVLKIRGKDLVRATRARVARIALRPATG
jgi:prolyl-tRNA editing enzyme YbaK/EbsC (Cys-tRNA(Pro) deacylase)